MFKISLSLFHKKFYQDPKEAMVSVDMHIGTLEMIRNALQIASKQKNDQNQDEYMDLYNQCVIIMNEANQDLQKIKV